MLGVLLLATIGKAALRAALVSMEIRTSTFFCEIKASKAFCAPAAPDASSATSSTSCRPSTPPLALISSTASCADWTTDGATTLLAPDSPTGTPILMGSAANAKLDSAAADAVKSNAAESERIGVMTSVLLLVAISGDGGIIDQYQPDFALLPSISS